MQPLVTTRPERTADDIAADKEEAQAFFDRMDRRTSNSRNFQRVLKHRIQAESYCGRLTACVAEGSVWAGDQDRNRNNPGPVARARRRAERLTERLAKPQWGDENFLVLDRTAFGKYVTRSTWKQMPPRKLHPIDAAEAMTHRSRLWQSMCLRRTIRALRVTLGVEGREIPPRNPLQTSSHIRCRPISGQRIGGTVISIRSGRSWS